MPKPHRKNDVLIYLTPRQTKTVLLNMRHLASESVDASYRRSSTAIVQRIEAALFRAERLKKQAQRNAVGGSNAD